jgi:DNA polymerase (family 10)
MAEIINKRAVARIFEEIALFLEIKGDNPFRIRAYRNGARVLLNMDEDLYSVVREKRLTDLEGIGDDLAEKITTLVLKGRLPFYEKLKKSIPSGLLELMNVQGLGAKKVKQLYDKLHIRTIPQLKKAAESGQISKLRGFGSKAEQNILDALSHSKTYAQRHLWWEAMRITEVLLEDLKAYKGVKRAEVAGSLRRKLETIGDIDFLVAASKPQPIMHFFTSHPRVERVLAKGETKSSVRLKNGMQADIRIVPKKQFAFALCYFTGSKEHNIALRKLSRRRGWSLSEWGLAPEKEKVPAFFKTAKILEEEDIYRVLDLQYIPPELREDQGEIQAAAKNRIPRLVEEKDMRGAFHNHTTASDGKNTLKEMVAAAEKLGWEYIGISDHSKSSFQANGLHEEELLKQIEQIKELNASKKFRPYVFAGTECDIRADGTLDFPNGVLKKCDYVIVSIHSSLQQDEKTMTKRLIRAIEHPYTTMIGHLTGRLLLRREPYALNIPKVIDACIANHKIIELNANPQRLDMDWRWWHAASQRGLLCSINTDAHNIDHLTFIRAGVNSARKGWLEKKHILNTLSLRDIQIFLKKLKP